MQRAPCAVRLRLASFCFLVLAVSAAGSGQESLAPSGQAASRPAPSEAEQQKMLAAMREYAGEYTAKLPNFICQQTTSQFEAGKKPTHWHKGDTLTSRLVFTDGREHRTLELVNNKPVRFTGRPWRAPLTTEGEFGILLANVFDPATATSFSWAGWDTFRGQPVAKFDYSIDRQHSTLSLSLSDLAKAVVPYHGSIFGDPATGAVRRITSETATIPEQVQTKSIATTVDYDTVRIGSQDYLLPVEANVVLVTDRSNIRNEMQFQGYRKFEAESTITFGSDTGTDGSRAEKPHNPQP